VGLEVHLIFESSIQAKDTKNRVLGSAGLRPGISTNGATADVATAIGESIFAKI